MTPIATTVASMWMILSLALVLSGGSVLAPFTVRAEEFADRYRSYQKDLRAARAALKKGDYPVSVELFTKAIELRDKSKVLEHARRAAELSSEKNAEILDTLAQAYFINGLKEESVQGSLWVYEQAVTSSAHP